MIQLSVLKDASEIIHYRNPKFPLYGGCNRLSFFPNREMLCHWHEDVEYIRAVQGGMFYFVNGERIVLREGDGILINARQMHYGFSQNGNDCQYECVVFRPQILSGNEELQTRYVQTLTESSTLVYTRLYQERDEDRELMGLFHQVLEVFFQEQSGYELECTGILNLCWRRWHKKAETVLQEIGEGVHRDLAAQKRMVEFLSLNCRQKLTLSDIAKAGGVCRSKCCQIFKKYLHKSPMDFLNLYRLRLSTSLLENTAYSITEIAFSCGFGSSSYYAECFAKYKGCSPGEFRRRQKYGFKETASAQA